MPTCKEVAEAVASDAVTRASWRERLSIRLHLIHCPPCRRYVRQIKALGVAARRFVASQMPDREALDRLKARILDDVIRR